MPVGNWGTMYFSDLGASLRRRWYFVLVGVLITLGLAAGAAKMFPATYSGQAVVVLLPPRSADAANPYLAIGGSEGVVPALTAAMTDSKTVLNLEASGVSRKFTIGPDLAAGGPLVLVTTEEATPAEAIASLNTVLDRVSVVLNTLQADAGAPASSRVTADVIARDAKAQTVRKTQIRAVIAVVAAGLALTVLLTAALDGLLMRRRSGAESAGRNRNGKARRSDDASTEQDETNSTSDHPDLRSPATVASGDAPLG